MIPSKIEIIKKIMKILLTSLNRQLYNVSKKIKTIAPVHDSIIDSKNPKTIFKFIPFFGIYFLFLFRSFLRTDLYKNKETIEPEINKIRILYPSFSSYYNIIPLFIKNLYFNSKNK
ncbi:hypothetical protein O3801_00850 [Gemella sp. 27098_8_149]|uniref:hypothetical protein n=1 Tax=Gemella sp. 27098_8_149 TaxID=3003689 RepID=UPI00352F80F1